MLRALRGVEEGIDQLVQLTRSRELTVRMGDYESYKFSATVVATHHDLGYTDEEWVDMKEVPRNHAEKALQYLVAEQLDVALEQDIEDAAELTGDRKSFIRRAIAPATATATAKKTD